MRVLAGGVSVITVGRGKDITGMTVTSVSSLSVDPPTLIVSVNRESSSWPLLQRYGAFGVNILSADQLDVAERFSGKGGLKGADRFVGAQWVTRATGVPLLAGALRRSTATSRKSSSATPTPSSSAASAMSSRLSRTPR
jgi:flavin reductase (DIM6/NTAB) family NADH-FMN oxidoreductase RutF